MNILLNGATGRVGRCIESLVVSDDELDIVGRGTSDAPLSSGTGADVLIDFSSPEALMHALSLAVDLGIPLVSGTTGLDDEQRAALDEAAGSIAICHAANFSVGVHVLTALVRDAAARLGGEFDVELVETHHRNKVDAPSGTALSLGRALADARGATFSDAAATGARSGRRRPGDIGIQALRGGDVIGDHEVHFLGDGERLELTHRATDRSLFARGALRAARWLPGRAPGLYGLGDVLAG